MSQEIYQTPLATRYSSKEMTHLYSDQYKHTLWRKLWVALAKSEQILGLPITNAQIEELEAQTSNIDFQAAAKHEKATRHDVMAHILTYADQCPKARPIIHLGSTSCFITDNADLIQMREGLTLIQCQLVEVVRCLSAFALKHKDLPCLAFTHFQAAQPTTVGKRACLWIQDFLLDLTDLEFRMNHLQFLGVKGATGTQASFLTLFDGDRNKILQLEQLVAKEMGFSHIFPISGQTYTRKQDVQILNVLMGIAVSSHKIATDLRLLAHLKEIEESFQEDQVGSSAMPYKRNPIKSERICSLARYVISLCENPVYTASVQWLERSLDDSANRRLCIPEAFLATDAILRLLLSVIPSLDVYPNVIASHLKEELPFLITEEILMEGVKKGGDRQQMHERLRVHSQAAAKRIKEEGKSNDLCERIIADPHFKLTAQEIEALLMSNRFIGAAPEQVADFLTFQVGPMLEKYGNIKVDPVHIEV